MCCHTEIEVVDQTYYLTHGILTLGKPVIALILECQLSGMAGTRVPVSKPLVKRPMDKAGFDLRSAALKIDTLPLAHRGNH